MLYEVEVDPFLAETIAYLHFVNLHMLQLKLQSFLKCEDCLQSLGKPLFDQKSSLANNYGS